MILSAIQQLIDFHRLRNDPQYLAAFIGYTCLALAFLRMLFTPPRPRYYPPATPLTNTNPTPSEKKRLTYRTRNGLFYMIFSFEKISTGWRIYIEATPSYESYGRDSGAHSTHRLTDGSRSYVCWSQAIETFDHAKSVARAWSEATSDYLLTGTTF